MSPSPYQIMVAVLKPSDFKCYAPLSEPFSVTLGLVYESKVSVFLKANTGTLNIRVHILDMNYCIGRFKTTRIKHEARNISLLIQYHIVNTYGGLKV
jgi:hypothetical protein